MVKRSRDLADAGKSMELTLVMLTLLRSDSLMPGLFVSFLSHIRKMVP